MAGHGGAGMDDATDDGQGSRASEDRRDGAGPYRAPTPTPRPAPRPAPAPPPAPLVMPDPAFGGILGGAYGDLPIPTQPILPGYGAAAGHPYSFGHMLGGGSYGGDLLNLFGPVAPTTVAGAAPMLGGMPPIAGYVDPRFAYAGFGGGTAYAPGGVGEISPSLIAAFGGGAATT